MNCCCWLGCWACCCRLAVVKSAASHSRTLEAAMLLPSCQALASDPLHWFCVGWLAGLRGATQVKVARRAESYRPVNLVHSHSTTCQFDISTNAPCHVLMRGNNRQIHASNKQTIKQSTWLIPLSLIQIPVNLTFQSLPCHVLTGTMQFVHGGDILLVT